jgi:hypothetical protein
MGHAVMTTNRHTMLGTTACFAYCLLLLHTWPTVFTAMAEVQAEVSAASSAGPHAAALAQLFASPAAAAGPELAATIDLASEDERTGDKPAAGSTGADEDKTTADIEDADAAATRAGIQGAAAATRAGIEVADADGDLKAEDDGGAETQSDAAPSEASSGKRRSKPLLGSASVQAALDVLEETPYCTKCSYPIDEMLRAKLYGKQSGRPSFICRGCNCVIAMVGKHMDLDLMACKGMSFADLQGTTQGEAFFRQAQEAADAHGRLAWNQVRELLMTALTERRLQLVKIKFTDKELPLSVWETQGFNAEEIKKYGAKVDHPVFSDVYKAPLKETSRADVRHP